MSANLNAQPMELKAMVAGAAAKERRNLGVSIVFTLIVLAIGFGWIAYSANKVVKLKAQEAALNDAIAKAKTEVAEQEGLLRKLSFDIANVKPTLDQCNQGNGNQDTKIAVAALASAQESVQAALNNPIRVDPKPPGQTPSPAPALVPVPSVTKMSFTDAEQKIRAAGFTAVRVDQSGKAPPGTVLYQDPIPG
ncbi:MAG TPA: PASTA domain-containing protein, partial [Pyrinomonadaceae bacterium]|nr:PASTA domain-containing protein [Pyrinomonadaceae bacterium]